MPDKMLEDSSSIFFLKKLYFLKEIHMAYDFYVF